MQRGARVFGARQSHCHVSTFHGGTTNRVPATASGTRNMRAGDSMTSRRALVSIVVITVALSLAVQARRSAVAVPAPVFDPADSKPTDTAVLAGGCFWGVQAVFEHVRGVTRV